MGGMLDKVLLAGLGIEHKVKEKINGLANEGNDEEGEGLGMKEDIENRLVENIVEAVGGGLKKVGLAKKEVDAVLASIAEDIAEKLQIVTVDEFDVLEKLLMKNREKTDKMEKRIKKLESHIEKLMEKGKER